MPQKMYNSHHKGLPDVSNVVEEANNIIKQCFQQYSLDEVFISFNGGKDCMVLLDLTLRTLKEVYRIENFQNSLKVVYIRTKNPFRELESFVKEIEQHYNLKLLVAEGEMKGALSCILEQDPKLKACLMGTRRTDPHSKDLQYMQKTDSNWPQIMRVSPLLNWSYHQIWSYLLGRKVPYCSLYDIGYTSIGSTTNTKPNPALAYRDSLGRVVFRPAWQLTDPSLERAGRNTNTANGHV